MEVRGREEREEEGRREKGEERSAKPPILQEQKAT